MDYYGAMGVPITFLDKYNPAQFEIIKFRKGDDDRDLSIGGKCPYFRILIRRKQISSTVKEYSMKEPALGLVAEDKLLYGENNQTNE